MRDKAGAADMLRSRAGKKQRPGKRGFSPGDAPPFTDRISGDSLLSKLHCKLVASGFLALFLFNTQAAV